MGLQTLWKRAVALLAAVGLSACLAAGISADDENSGSEAETPLRPTEIAAEIPEEYETLFTLQWGGGSLPQLRGRLEMMGCALNTLWLYDRERWNGYNRYDLPYDFPINRQFIEHYGQGVPASTLYATCADQPAGNNLQPTQIIAEIPDAYDETFELQWGGGSLIHFKGRLATMGCVANNIQFADASINTIYIYNQYNTYLEDPINQQFLASLEQFMPAGTFSADCYNICEFKGKECISFEEMKERENNYATNDDAEWDISPEMRNSTCTNDFHPLVRERVLPLLPMRPDVCVVRAKSSRTTGGRYVSLHINTIPFIVIFDNPNAYNRIRTIENIEYNEYNDMLLHVEIHELCHVNQQWDWHSNLKKLNSFVGQWWDYFRESEHGKEFRDIVGYSNGNRLSVDNIYRNIYNIKVIELSAEICALYLLDKIGAKSVYNYKRWAGDGFIKVPVRAFDTSPYLTPEVVEWLETYLILPEITE